MARLVILSPMDQRSAAERFPGHDVSVVGRDEDPAAGCKGSDAVISDWTGHHQVAGAVVDALAPTCRLVQSIGAGYDSIDAAACAAAGIPVASGSGLNADAVAEWCLWGAISAQRLLTASDRLLAGGGWTREYVTRYDLATSRVGIIGLGSIGRACAARFVACRAEVVYWSRRRRPAEVEAELGVSWLELEELMATSDVVIVMVALTDRTRGLVSRELIAKMKPSAVLVNAARGPVVDEDALVEALRDKRIHGAALDVFDEEPLPEDHRYRDLDNVTLTPHLAGVTQHALSAITQGALDNIDRVLRGEPPLRLVHVEPR